MKGSDHASSVSFLWGLVKVELPKDSRRSDENNSMYFINKSNRIELNVDSLKSSRTLMDEIAADK